MSTDKIYHLAKNVRRHKACNNIITYAYKKYSGMCICKTILF